MATHVDRVTQIALADGTLVDDANPLPASVIGNGAAAAVNGLLVVGSDSLPVNNVAINATASGDTPVVAAVPGKKIRVVALTFTVDAAVTVAWKSGTNGIIPAMAFAARGGMDVNRQPAGFWMETNVGEALVLNLSGTVNAMGGLNYVLV